MWNDEQLEEPYGGNAVTEPPPWPKVFYRWIVFEGRVRREPAWPFLQDSSYSLHCVLRWFFWWWWVIFLEFGFLFFWGNGAVFWLMSVMKKLNLQFRWSWGECQLDQRNWRGVGLTICCRLMKEESTIMTGKVLTFVILICLLFQSLDLYRHLSESLWLIWLSSVRCLSLLK